MTDTNQNQTANGVIVPDYLRGWYYETNQTNNVINFTSTTQTTKPYWETYSETTTI